MEEDDSRSNNAIIHDLDKSAFIYTNLQFKWICYFLLFNSWTSIN
jgi:hypothetical protein